MHLNVYTPTGLVLDKEIDQIDVEAIDGFYTLLPRHVDFVTALALGITTYHAAGQKAYIAVNEGILVKQGALVRLATRQAVLGNDLSTLTHLIETDFKRMQQQRKESAATLARLEIGLTKGFLRLNAAGGPDGGI